MKKSQKINSLIVMALVACFTVMFGLFLFLNPSVQKASATEATITMLDTDIRLDSEDTKVDGDKGLRFNFKVDAATYEALLANSSAEVGVVIAPADSFEGTLTVDTAKAIKALSPIGVGDWKLVGEEYVSCVYLKNIPVNSYNRPISAVAFVDWKDESPVQYAASPVTVAIADVALASRVEADDEFDSYIKDYKVTFIDAYGNSAEQNVEYGSDMEVTDPTARAGYDFKGWQLKTGATSYADPAAITEKKVAYDMTFKASFDAVGPTYEKPVQSSWLYGGGLEDTKHVGNTLQVKGAYLFKDAEIAAGTNYVLSATFTRTDTKEVGFVITTKSVEEWTATENAKDLLFVYRKSGDMYLWGENIWHSVSTVTAPAVDEEMKLQIVYKNGTYYVLINDSLKCSVAETASLTDGKTIKNALGEGNVKVGIVSTNAVTTFTDWRYSVDADLVEELVPTQKTFENPKLGSWLYGSVVEDAGISDGKLKVKGVYLFDGAKIEKGTNFAITTTFTRSNASEFGFVITDNNDWSGSVKDIAIVYRRDKKDIYIWGDSPRGIWMEYKSLAVAMPAVEEEMMLTLVYKNGTYYLFIGDKEALSIGENDKPDWNITIAEALGSGDDLYLGIASINTPTTYTYWAYTVDEDLINMFVPDPVPPVPAGYTAVDYIASTGTQYIDTGFKADNNTKVVVNLDFATQTDSRYAFGYRKSSSAEKYAFSTVEGSYVANYGTQEKYLGKYSGFDDFSYPGEAFTVTRDKAEFFINETKLGENTEVADFTCSGNMYIFALNNNGSASKQATMKLYSMQIFDNGTLVRDFVPCTRDLDGVAGLYDKVNDVFYTNSGSGTFEIPAAA